MSHSNGRRGTYYKPQPVDFVLLEKLPEDGMIGGIHWKGRQLKDLRQEIIDGGVDAGILPLSFVSARMRSMAVEGLVVNRGTTMRSAAIWARTTEGTNYLAKREEIIG